MIKYIITAQNGRKALATSPIKPLPIYADLIGGRVWGTHPLTFPTREQADAYIEKNYGLPRKFKVIKWDSLAEKVTI